MPSREISTKGRKNDTTSKQSYKYANADEIRRSLRLKEQNEGGLIDALTALRNQLTVKYGDLSIPANDERLLLIKSWLDLSPGAQDIFSIWEEASSRQMSLLAVIVATLSSTLTLLSSHYTYHAYAQPIMRTLLTAQWAHRLNSYLAGTHTELLLVTLKLFNSMSEFAGGRERKSVLEVFAWETKSLPKLLHMRRKTKGDDTIEILSRPDIRTLYILFVLSFVQSSTPSIVKATFLEQRRDAFTAIFKGLSQDSYSVVRKVLEVCWTGIWSDPKLKRTLKIAIFNEVTLSQLLRLYDRMSSEGDDPESVPADVVHHFLLALCSHPGVGLCFKDRGWYPREIELDQRVAPDGDDPFTENPRSRGGRIYNKALANVVKGLKVNEDPRQQELALKILAACPELIAGYWSAAALALEPRLSSKWIANIAFFGSVISMPVPMESFYLPEGSSVSLYQPVPPPLSTIIDNILPSMNIKIHLSRGLQSPSPLVQHCTALALVKSLLKYEAVMRAFDQVEKALEEDEDGQWSKRRREVVREVRKRVPDFQVIVGFSQKLNELAHSTLGGAAAPNVPVQAANPGRTALLLESAHRLLWLYHLLLPSVVAEARFDAGKLLQGLDDISSPTDIAKTTAGLDALRQLHVLRLLKDSEQFTWSGKTASKHSNLHILLKAYVDTDVPPIRAAITSLLCQVLPNGVLFQHDASEILLWLDSLPTTRRASGAEAPDGTILTDESDSVISFLDDCAQRCIKTPYRYLEELQALWSLPSDDSLGQVHTMVERPDTYPSPLLVTVLEQLSAKLKGKLVSPSDALAIVTFVRKLAFRLAGKATSLDLLNGLVEKLDAVVQPENLYPSNPIVTSAISREVALLVLDLHHLRSPSGAVVESISPAVQEFLIQIEQLPARKQIQSFAR
ncbi:Uncharacterized protein C14G10.02 [Grifola frondosa]|uniref:Uncharacterized protein C14G10.02 n=1 Tax=Grifola frondosa TaxID=5627 RepID=A0A1C7M4B2_GRIFR|nr:Uncharacterized protein C14G10.02 [Grifola frondosa]